MTDKSLKLYNGSDLLPVNDYTDEDWTDWSQTELAMAADGGDSTASTWQLRDEGGVIPDRSGDYGSYFLEAHNVVKLTVGSNTLFRGRLGYDDRKQGRQPAAGVDTHSNKGRAVEFTVTLADVNDDLRGIIVHAWSRPEETDVARVQALVAAYLSGNPRPSTNLNGSNFVVTGSNTFTVPAKTYYGVTPGEVLQEIAELTDKQMFVDVDENLHYHGNDYGWNAPIRISDDPDDLDAVTCVPIDASRAEESRDTLTALRAYWGNNTSGEQNTFQRTDTTKMAINDYWEDVFFDSESTTWAEASNRASNYFVPRKLDQTSYTVTIGKPGSPNGEPWTSAEIALAPKAGQLIDFKALKARGGRTDNHTWIGDFFLNRRIKEVRWTFPTADGFYCQLILDRPRHSLLGGTPFHKPQAPDTGTPGTPPTAPTTDLYWTFTDRGGVQSDNLLDDGTSTYYWATGGWDTNGNPGGRLWWGASGARLTPAFSVTPGVVYTFEADVKQAQTTANAYLRVEWYNSVNTQLQIDYIAGPGVGTGWATYTKVVTAPTGADHIFLRADSHTGTQAGADNIYIKHGGSGGTAGTPSTSGPTTVGGTGEGTYSDSGEYVPVGSVLEHSYITEGGPYHDADQIAIDDVGDYYTGTDVEAALQELGAAGGASSSSGPHSHPDLAEADFTITAAPEGGWGRITKNNLAYLNGYTYISYITGDDGDARVAVVADTDPSTVVNTVTLHVALAVDDHSAAVIAIDPSTHKLMTVYTTHGDTTVRTRVSTTSLDTDPDLGDGFASEQSLDAALGSSTYTYPNILYLADESKWYLFVRAGGSGSSADWYYSTSSDFSTWAAATKFFDEATRWVYLKPVVNGAARIDFIANDGSPANDTDVSTVAFYYEGGSWFDLDGNDLGTLPLSGADATLIADGATAETSIVDVAVLPDGNPAYLYADIEDTAHHFIHHVRWTGSALVDTTLVDSGAAIEATGTFSGHANMDPSDPMRVWVSVENGSGFYDLWQYSIEDDAPTGRRIAEGLTGADNLRPAGIPGHGDALHVVWLVGSYTDINTFDFGISGAGVTASAAGTDEKAKVSSNDTTAGYLNGKLVAGTNITLTENNDGSNETLTIAASGSGSDTAWIVDPGSPSYSGTGPVTVALTSVFGIDGSGNPYYNAAGVTDGEEAALVWDSTTGSYSLRPYYP